MVEANRRYIRKLLDLESRLRILQFVHDVLDITHPQFSYPDIDHEVEDYFKQVLPICQSIVTSSESNAQAIKNLMSDWGMGQAKFILLKPGTDLPKITKPKRPASIDTDNYILAVGSIEIRKNHTLFEQVYHLANERSIKLPHLYISGQAGFLVHELLYRLVADSILKDKITFIGRTSDEELAWLYQNARLSIDPSFCGGGGGWATNY